MPPRLLLPKRHSTWSELLLTEQDEALQFLLNLLRDGGGAGLFSEQGTGKTIISLALLEKLAPVLTHVLIVAPLTALGVTWGERITDTMPQFALHHSWEDFKAARRKAAHAPPAPGSRSKGVAPKPAGGVDLGGFPPQKHILLIHFEALSKLRDNLSRNDNLWDLVIIDELHRMKARGSGFSRAARRLRGAKRRLGLSGTPVDRSPIDVWAQMRFIDYTVLSQDWIEFSGAFCMPAGFKNYKWKFKPSQLPRFMDLIKPYIFRLSKEFLQLEPIRVHLEPVSLLGRQREIYDEMDCNSQVNINGDVFRGDLKMTKKIRLSQIAGGFLSNEDASVLVGHAKERRLATLLSKLKPPIVIFCRFLPELEIIERASKARFKRVALLYGGVKGEDRTELIHTFAKGNIDVLCCQMRTGGVSIELTAASKMIAYSMNYSFIDFEQFISRIHRGGQMKAVDFHVIYAEDTEDERILQIVDTDKRAAAWKIVQPLEQRR